MIKMSKKYELELRSLPFSRGDNQVIYVESEFNPAINKFIESHIEEIKAIFAKEFLDFCYVPEVCERFWEMGELDWYKIPYDKRLLRTYGTHLRTDEVFNHEVRMSEIEPSFICNERGVSLGDKLVFEAYHLDLSCLDTEYMMMDQLRRIAKAYSRKEAIDYKRVAQDEETGAMLSEMERLARALKLKGVKTQIFDDMIASLEQPSPLVIDWRGHVVLPEFGNMQIRLNPMEKTLYHFFLNHPEGILADALVGYRKQLLRQYRAASVFDEWELAENAIDALLDEDKKTFYINVSRIKTKFTSKLGDRIAAHYIIKKNDAGVYKIALSEDMVSYENKSWDYSYRYPSSENED